MSLLRLLNLPVPKSLLMAQGPAESGSAQANGSAVVARPPTMGAPQGQAANGSGPGADAVHAEAAKMRGVIEAKRKEAQERLDKLEKLGPVLKQMSDAATGEKKKELAAKQAVLVKKTAETEREIKEAVADLEAIENPGAKREELVSIMARRGARTHIESDIEVDSPGLDPYKKSVNHDRTTTTTEYADGKATTEKVHDKQHVGVGGYNVEHSNEKVVQTKDSTARTSEEKKSLVSWTGKASVDEKKASEVELADGRKSSAEHSTAKEISAKGASETTTDKVTNLDGSSTEKTKKQGVERSEGQVTATTSTTVTQTSKSGTAHATDKKASGGFDAKDGAMGAHGGLDGGKTVTNKKGMQAGATLSVHANVTCKIGEPKGEPKMYEVTLTVSFEGSVGMSAGAGKKEGSKAEIGVEVKGSLEKSMSLTHTLGEAQLADYTKALQDASKKGGNVAATHREFAIISAGVNQSWDVARVMWSKKVVSKETADGLGKGDSITVVDKQTGSVGANLKVKGIGVGGSETDTQEDTKKLARNDKGTLDLDTNSEHTRKSKRDASFDMGVAGMTGGTTHTHQTNFGYSITIDQKNDPDGKILEAVGACKSEAQYDAFIKKYDGKITLNYKETGEAEGDRTDAGASLGPLKAGIFTQQGVAKKKRVDAKGKVIYSKTVGSAGRGGDFGPIGDSLTDEATAEHDGEGNVTLKIEQTTNDKDYGKMARNKVRAVPGGSHLVGADKDKKDPKGALATASGGGEDDVATKDTTGIGLTTKDLKRIGQIAMTDPGRWTRAHHRTQERDHWESARREIVKAKGDPGVVADELASFIGGDRLYRLEMVTMFVRGGNATNVGSAYEFPDSLKTLRADYEKFILAPFLPDLEKHAAVNSGIAVGVALSLQVAVDALYTRFYQAKDFSKPALQAEMLGVMTKRRDAIAEAIRTYQGKTSAEDDRVATEAKVKRLLEHCFDFSASEKKLFDSLDDDLFNGEFRSADGKEIKDWLRQLKDLRTRWRENYDEAVKLAKSIGMRQGKWDQDILRPNEALYQKFYKAAEVKGMV